MIQSITFVRNAWEEYLHWQTQDKKMLKRVNQIIESTPMIKCKKVSIKKTFPS